MTTWARDPAVVWRRSLGRVLLKRVDADELLTLEGTGEALWRALGPGDSLEGLSQQLARAYAVSADVVLADLPPVLQDLEKRRLVLRRSP